MELTFKTKNKRQLEAAMCWNDDLTEQILYGGAKGGGKSYLGCSLIFGDALTYPETHYFIARKELTDLRKFTIPSIHEVFSNWGLKVDDYANFNGQDNCYTLYNKSKVYLIACKEEPSDPLFERLGSMQMTRGWIEEAGEVAEAAKANLWLSVGRWKNDIFGLKKKLLLTANPKKGWMKRDFIDPYQSGILPDNRKFIPAFVSDNKYMSADYIKTLSEIKDDATRERLFLGNWDYDEDKNSMVSEEALSDAFEMAIVKDGQRYLIIDVARFGDDSTVFALWDGLELIKVEKYSKQDTQETIRRARDFASANRVPYSNILIDADGIGGSVVDGMPGVRSFIALARPVPTPTEIRGKLSRIESHLVPKTVYANLKAQCAFKLAELINEHQIAFRVPEYRGVIIEELTALLKQKDKDEEGRLKIVPKDEVKTAIGHSPDLGDTIIYRVWFELNKLAGSNGISSAAIEKQKYIWAQNEKKILNDSTR